MSKCHLWGRQHFFFYPNRWGVICIYEIYNKLHRFVIEIKYQIWSCLPHRWQVDIGIFGAWLWAIRKDNLTSAFDIDIRHRHSTKSVSCQTEIRIRLIQSYEFRQRRNISPILLFAIDCGWKQPRLGFELFPEISASSDHLVKDGASDGSLLPTSAYSSRRPEVNRLWSN